MNGWVKLHRKLTEWEWYNDSSMVHLFIHLLLNASNRDCKWKGVDVKRGQVVVGRKQLSADTGISEKTIRTCLNRLKTASVTASESTNKYTIVTILNYDEYQVADYAEGPADGPAIGPTTGQQGASKGPAKGHIVRSKEVKNNKKNTSFSPITVRPDWISEGDWRDVITHRKAVKAANTERAYKNLINQLQEAVSAGFTIGECVDAMTDKTWIGFKAEWMANLKARKAPAMPRGANSGATGVNGRVSQRDANRAIAMELLGDKFNEAQTRDGSQGHQELAYPFPFTGEGD